MRPKSKLLELSMTDRLVSSSRRTLLKNSAVAGAYLIGPRAFANASRNSFIDVGDGAFGGWTALQLLKIGAKVTLIDAWGPGNARAHSGGGSRNISGSSRSGR